MLEFTFLEQVLALVCIILVVFGVRERRHKRAYFSRLQALNYKEAELERLAEPTEEVFTIWDRIRAMYWRFRMRRRYSPQELERLAAEAEGGGEKQNWRY
jgi:predicted LPLAT superfamily acyltransferase